MSSPQWGILRTGRGSIAEDVSVGKRIPRKISKGLDALQREYREVAMTLEIILLAMSVLGICEGARLSGTVLLFADSVGPGWYLFFMSCLLFVCAIALLVRKYIKRKAAHGEVSLSLHKGAAGQALILLVAYGVVAMYVGYVIASLMFFVLAQRIFGERSWLRCAAIGASITACFYVVFSYLAQMPLP